MRAGFAALLILALGVTTAHAQPSSQPRKSHVVVWTAVGAGAGFALGTVAGLGMFDDAINSDRKVWTTAIVSAAAGGVVALLLSRPRKVARHPANRLTDAEVRALVASVRFLETTPSP
jgi:4-amino-4-deoxy-L-arabinose transferase-like glycosyltransferase